MAGHTGVDQITVQNLIVLQVKEAENILLVSGSVPGSNGSYLIVRPAIKKRAEKAKA
jgi:large subunit ribosomal protein L3